MWEVPFSIHISLLHSNQCPTIGVIHQCLTYEMLKDLTWFGNPWGMSYWSYFPAINGTFNPWNLSCEVYFNVCDHLLFEWNTRRLDSFVATFKPSIDLVVIRFSQPVQFEWNWWLIYSIHFCARRHNANVVWFKVRQVSLYIHNVIYSKVSIIGGYGEFYNLNEVFKHTR